MESKNKHIHSVARNIFEFYKMSLLFELNNNFETVYLTIVHYSVFFDRVAFGRKKEKYNALNYTKSGC